LLLREARPFFFQSLPAYLPCVGAAGACGAGGGVVGAGTAGAAGGGGTGATPGFACSVAGLQANMLAANATTARMANFFILQPSLVGYCFQKTTGGKVLNRSLNCKKFFEDIAFLIQTVIFGANYVIKFL
jgi:hypothetical protein